MRYDVRVKNHDGSESLMNMVYRVRSVTPSPDEDEEYDAVVHADWAAGPAQAGFRS